jgi:P450-derived glycosyltransferase activator
VPNPLIDVDWGHHLLMMRGMQLVYRAEHDPYLAVLRESEADYSVLYDGLWRSGTGAWVAGSHALGNAILRDPALDTPHPALPAPQVHRVTASRWTQKFCHVLPLEPLALNLSRADYQRLGRLAEPVLGTRSLEAHSATVRRICEAALIGLDDEFDLMRDFAAPTAARTAALLLGVPPQEEDTFADACSALGGAMDATLCVPAAVTAKRMAEALHRAESMVARLDDVLVRHPSATATDVKAVCVLMMSAGVELAAVTLCSAMSALLANPDQWSLLRGDPGLAGAAVEEALRHQPPVRLQSFVAQCDVKLGGQPVSADSQVVLAIEAANRDPAVYSDPATFDLTRLEPPHLSLADWRHTALVAPLVRLYTATALTAFATGLPSVSAAGAPVRRPRSPIVRRVASWPARR